MAVFLVKRAERIFRYFPPGGNIVERTGYAPPAVGVGELATLGNVKKDIYWACDYKITAVCYEKVSTENPLDIVDNLYVPCLDGTTKKWNKPDLTPQPFGTNDSKIPRYNIDGTDPDSEWQIDTLKSSYELETDTWITVAVVIGGWKDYVYYASWTENYKYA